VPASHESRRHGSIPAFSVVGVDCQTTRASSLESGNPPAIRAVGLRQSYGNHLVLDGIDLEAKRSVR